MIYTHHDGTEQGNENENKILKEELVINLYKNKGSKIFKYISSFDLLLAEINSELYNGCEIDLEHICNIYNNCFLLFFFFISSYICIVQSIL